MGFPIHLRFMVLTFVPSRSAWAPIHQTHLARLTIAWFVATFGCALATVAALLDRRLGEAPRPAAPLGPARARSQGESGDPSDPHGLPPAPGVPGPGSPPVKPPSTMIVHRQPEGPPLPPAGGKRRRAFGHDPLEDRRAPKALRRAVDDLLGDLEDRRNDDRGDGAE